MIFFGGITISGGRIRGLQSAVFSDEAVPKADVAVQLKRVQTLVAQSGAVTCDWSLYDEYRISTTGPISLTFTGATDGQGCILTLKGGNAASLPVNVRFNSVSLIYYPTTGPGAIDKLGFFYDLSELKYDLVSVVKGLV